MLRAFLAPVLGGIIGYITNDLAIRMLFRPRKAYYIGKFHIPFTPGLIPSQQGRIAQSIGSVVSDQLLNEETLRQTLLSQEAIQKLQDKVREFIHGLADDERTINGMLKLREEKGEKRIDVDALQQKITLALAGKIVSAKLGYAVIDSVIGDKMDVITQNKLFLSLVGNDTQEAIKRRLAGMIDDLIAEKAPEVSAAIVNKYRNDLFDMRICDLYAKYQDKEDMLIQKATELYVNLLGDNLGKLLRAINIEKIVVDKINGLDPAGLEAVIFGIMKRELRAIVYLGALLGFLMGFINLLL